ncbi:MAG: hypothetical protein PHG06_00015 [Parabacteroides sp.]|nr:hypothetical protein [Parabacteroides sp.]
MDFLSLDYTKEDFETRKWEIFNSLSTDGLDYVREHIFDIVVNKLEKATNKAIEELEKIEKEQKVKHALAIEQCKKEEHIKCNYRIAGVLVVVVASVIACIGFVSF